jgi:hypothetical protein
MKRRKSIYILLPIVIFIWATVLYQLFSYTAATPVVVENREILHEKVSGLKPIDTSLLNVNYRDPFLGKVYRITAPIKHTLRSKPKEPPIVWPLIIYKGMVSDERGSNGVFMLIIDGKTMLMKKGSSEKGVVILEGNRQSVTLGFSNKRNIIYLKP